jgi:hypothetical protein
VTILPLLNAEAWQVHVRITNVDHFNVTHPNHRCKYTQSHYPQNDDYLEKKEISVTPFSKCYGFVVYLSAIYEGVGNSDIYLEASAATKFNDNFLG